MVVSCNAYFAQLATYKVGAPALLDTANLLGISVANPPTAAKLRDALPQAGYGQGQVVATPFQMARVAATVAGGREDAVRPLGAGCFQRARGAAQGYPGRQSCRRAGA